MSATAKHHNIKHKCYLAKNGNSMMVLIIDIINNDEDFDFKSISVIISPRKCKSMPLVRRGLTPSFLLILRRNK